MSSAISLPFSFDSGGSVSFTEDERKMWQDRVVLAVMTQLTERVMRPTYGSDIKQALFMNKDDAIYMIGAGVRGAFSTWLPTLNLLNVKYENDGNEILSFEIFYAFNTGLGDSVTITTAILSRSGDVIVEVQNGR